MLRTAFLLAVLVAVASALAPLHQVGEPVEGEYIVVFNRDVSDAEVIGHYARSHRLGANHHVTRQYEMTRLKGYAAKLSEEALAAVRASPAVDYVEQNGVVRISLPVDQTMLISQMKTTRARFTKSANDSCNVQDEATWGIVRTAERRLLLDGVYAFNAEATAANVDAYIVDTCIYLEHSDFEGRAVWGTDTAEDPSPETDTNGHGTHVAGTVGSVTFGLAKNANLIAVRVLGTDGSGTNAGVIAGVAYVEAQKKKTRRPSVANMSLGGGKSAALNQAVASAVDAGVIFAVAAGNDGQTLYGNACLYSPASEPSAITVASSTNKDARSSFSNHGSCVDIFAPGSAITSTWIGGKYATNTISGTSMASPHVCGVAAKYLSAHPDATPAEVSDALIALATEDIITDAKANTPNKLLFADCA